MGRDYTRKPVTSKNATTKKGGAMKKSGRRNTEIEKLAGNSKKQQTKEKS